MIQLKNNCRVSELSIYPKDWENPKADPSLVWTISYRFYDDNEKQVKKVIIKGMNRYKSLKEKQEAVRLLVAEEKQNLEMGFNPISKYLPTPPRESPIDENTPFHKALDYVFNQKDFPNKTRLNVRSILKYFNQASMRLGFYEMPVAKISRRHVKLIMEDIGKARPDFSNNYYNKYRSYISILFSELVELEIFELNPVAGIKKKKEIKKERLLLTMEERKRVNEYLFKNHYSFWRFSQIFFHSGCRISEMMFVKKEKVDFENQRFMVVVKKDKVFREEWRTMKTIAIPFWMEICEKALPGQYLFGKGLEPANIPIDPNQVTRRWKRLIKNKDLNENKGLNIKADFYSLKHSNLDEVSGLMGIKMAKEMAGHTNEKITEEYYALGEKERNHVRLKSLENSFA